MFAASLERRHLLPSVRLQEGIVFDMRDDGAGREKRVRPPSCFLLHVTHHPAPLSVRQLKSDNDRCLRLSQWLQAK